MMMIQSRKNLACFNMDDERNRDENKFNLSFIFEKKELFSESFVQFT